MIDDFLKIRWIGVQPFRILRPIDARRAMTIRAALCGECLGAGLHAGRIVDGGWGPILRMAIDRCRTDLDQRPTDDRRILNGTSAALMPTTIASAPITARIRIFVSNVPVSNYRRQTYMARYPVCLTLS